MLFNFNKTAFIYSDVSIESCQHFLILTSVFEWFIQYVLVLFSCFVLSSLYFLMGDMCTAGFFPLNLCNYLNCSFNVKDSFIKVKI